MITSHFSVYTSQLFLSETLDISTVYIVAPGALKGHGAVFTTAMYELLKKLLWKRYLIFHTWTSDNNMFHPWHKGAQNHGAVTIDDLCLIDWVRRYNRVVNVNM